MHRKEFAKKGKGYQGNFNQGGFQGNRSKGGGNGGFGQNSQRPQTAQTQNNGLFSKQNPNQSRFGGGEKDFESSQHSFRQSKQSDGFQMTGYGKRGGNGGYGNKYENKDRGGGYNNHYDKENRGGGGGQRQRGGFPSKGQKSLVAISQNPEEAQSQKLMVTTNQFKLKIGENCPVLFQYPVRIQEEQVNADLEDVHQYTIDEITKVVDRESKRIEMLVGKFIHSGFNIWTTQQLTEENFLIESKLSNSKVTLVIEREGEFVVNPADINNTDRQNCQAMSQVLNVVVKEAMRETGLIQMGKRPQFFNYQDPKNIQNMNMQIWKGFKTCAYKYSNECTLVIDNCYKFMSTNTVLDLINEIYDQIDDQCQNLSRDRIIQIFQNKCRQKIVNSSVIANYGKRRTYIVHDIIFEPGPCASFFELKNNESISVAKYFYQTYKLKVTDRKQPMLIIKQQGKQVKIPSEFCLVDGVPDEIRNSSQAMRQLLGAISQKPHEKMKSLETLMNSLNNMKKWKDFDITIDDKPEILESRRLDLPELKHKEGNGERLFCSERLLKQMPVFNSSPLQQKHILLFHSRKNAQSVDSTIQSLQKCQSQLRIKTGKIYSYQVPDAQDKNLKNEIINILEDFQSENRIKNPTEEIFVIVMVNYDNDYHPYKNVLTQLSLYSQVIHRKSFGKGLNLSVASNIMKQINSKSGGESIQVKLPRFCYTSKVMLIGIDVCHAGKNSVVGFVTTTNQSFTSHFADIILQPKYQEIVKKDLDKCLERALNDFEVNCGGLPDKFIIYRDGTGEQQRQQVLEKEIVQLKEVLKDRYNKMNPPQITLIVVNKRINQRMFCEDRGQVVNPPPGTIIDKKLVENQDNQCYDFFLVPQQTTVGCVKPTHFYVAFNESYKEVSKDDIENLTFCQTFMYSNWSGSIKVPAVCQLAHKIAEYHHQFDNGNLKRNKFDQKQLCYNDNMLSLPYFL